MIGPWYDPLTERWQYPKEKPPVQKEPEVKSSTSAITQEVQKIWDAIVDVSSA